MALDKLVDSSQLDSGLTTIANAIRAKTGDSAQLIFPDDFSSAINNISTGEAAVQNPALALVDWEGTVLKEYAAADVAALTSMPSPSTLSKYASVDHEYLSFQEWNRSLANIKTWVTNHPGKELRVGAIYTTTDGQDHNYWRNSRLESTASAIYMQKRGTASIGSSAFYDFRALASINIPDSVTSIGDSAFNGCYSLTTINIPDSVTSIGDSAFNACYSLTTINIPDSVTSIGSYVFNGCYSLTTINIPDSVTSIGSYVFNACSSLTSINISDGVTSISDNAFKNCSSLVDVVIRGKPALNSVNAFGNTNANILYYVPRANLSWFETATNWSTFYTNSEIVAIEDHIQHLTDIGIDVSAYTA